MPAFNPIGDFPVRLSGALLRQPRLQVLVNGKPLPAAKETVVTSTGAFGADVFTVRAAVNGEAAYWAAATQIDVDVQISLSADGGFVSLVQGMADAVAIDPLNGVLTLEGRDGSAALMETRTQETFANQTASEIAIAIAARHGLASDVQPTSAPVGRYWELEHNRLTLASAARAMTEWDLLATLAQHEGVSLWVSQGTLHFRQPSMPVVELPTAALTALRVERALTLAGDLSVTIRSWHSRAGVDCVAVAKTSRGAAASRSYVFVVPNLDQTAAESLARRRLDELSAHELRFEAEMPGELTMTPRGQVRLTGTGTAFDTLFTIDEIERRLSVSHGFSQCLRGRAASAF